MSNTSFSVLTEIEHPEYIVQVRKLSETEYQVGYLVNGVFEIKHPDCSAEDVMRVLSHYCSSAYYQLTKQKNS